MPDQLLNLLKIFLLLLLYLFFVRVLRAVWAEVQPPKAPAAPAKKPAYGSFGFDEAGMDKSIAPGDDFYGYANGTWAKTTAIPADRSNFGMFTVLDELSTHGDVLGVYGNNDGEDLRAVLPEIARREIEGVRIAVVHETGQKQRRARHGENGDDDGSDRILQSLGPLLM